MKHGEEYVTKFDSNGNPVIVRNPDYYEDGVFHKRRNKHTNLTPKKKKRKR